MYICLTPISFHFSFDLFTFILFIFYFLINFIPNVGLELMTQRSRVDSVGSLLLPSLLPFLCFLSLCEINKIFFKKIIHQVKIWDVLYITNIQQYILILHIILKMYMLGHDIERVSFFIKILFIYS